MELFPFGFPCRKSRGYPRTAPSKGLGALSSQRRVKTEHPPWLNIELWKVLRSGNLNSHYLMEKGFEEDSAHNLPQVPPHSTHWPYPPCEAHRMQLTHSLLPLSHCTLLIFCIIIFFFSQDPFMGYMNHTVNILLSSAQEMSPLPVPLGRGTDPS